MTSKKPRRRSAPPPCAELHEDDGVDPRAFFRAGKAARKTSRKTLQLCSQVQDALNYLLADDGNDELLELFRVAEVRPAPDASQLLVIVQPAMHLTVPLDPREVLGCLARASGRLRSGVAAAITRKRAPKLLFQLAGASAEGRQ
jgi:ribosome-binding factor A